MQKIHLINVANSVVDTDPVRTNRDRYFFQLFDGSESTSSDDKLS